MLKHYWNRISFDKNIHIFETVLKINLSFAIRMRNDGTIFVGIHVVFIVFIGSIDIASLLCSKLHILKDVVFFWHHSTILLHFIERFVDCFVFYAAFSNFSVWSGRFLGGLLVKLVRLSWHQTVSRNAKPATLRAN